MNPAPARDAWRSRIRQHVQGLVIDTNDDLASAPRQFNLKFGRDLKLYRPSARIAGFPQPRPSLLGGSGQPDAELYAEATQQFGDRIAAIYIRDVDPEKESLFDRGVDAHVGRVVGTSVPTLHASHNVAIAERAAGLSLLAAASLPGIAADAVPDQ